MMNKQKPLLALLLLLLMGIFSAAQAQTIEVEKASAISRKAKKGAVDEIVFNSKTNEYEVTYITSDKDLWKKRRIKWETYFFDATSYELKRQEDGEEDYDKVKTKFPKFAKRFREKDEYIMFALGVEKNLVGTLVLRKKQISYEWSWFWGAYDIEVKVLEKLKPKTDENEKFGYVDHIEEDSTGLAVILASVKEKGSGMAGVVGFSKDFHVMRYNVDLDRLSDGSISLPEPMRVYKTFPLVRYKDDGSGEIAEAIGFDIVFQSGTSNKMTFVRVDAYGKVVSKVDADFKYPQQVVFEGQLRKKVGENSRVIGLDMLLAPTETPFNKSVEKDPNPKNYSYIRVNMDKGVIEAQGNFESPKVRLDVQQYYISEYEDAWYLYCTSTNSKEKYFNTTIPGKKLSDLHLLKIKNGKVAFVSNIEVTSLATKFRPVPGGKPVKAIKGVSRGQQDYAVSKDGEVLAAWNAYNVGKKGAVYTNPYVYHFDQGGNMKSIYATTYLGKSGKLSGAGQTLIENGGDKVVWYLQEIEGVAGAGKGRPKLLTFPRLHSIDLPKGEITSIVQPGKEKGKQTFYLDNTFPILPSADDTKMVFFGNDKSGKRVWFARISF